MGRVSFMTAFFTASSPTVAVTVHVTVSSVVALFSSTAFLSVMGWSALGSGAGVGFSDVTTVVALSVSGLSSELDSSFAVLTMLLPLNPLPTVALKLTETSEPAARLPSEILNPSSVSTTSAAAGLPSILATTVE